MRIPSRRHRHGHGLDPFGAPARRRWPPRRPSSSRVARVCWPCALSNGPAGADTTLGGFTVTALAESISAQYEQPNFPLPATPSLEFDEGYASTTDNFGPTGSALGLDPLPGPGRGERRPGARTARARRPAAGGADLAHPGGERLSRRRRTRPPPTCPALNMDAQSTTNGNTATATIGDDAATAGSNGGDPTQQAPTGTGNPLAGSSGLLGVGVLSATSSSQAPSTSATRHGDRHRRGHLHAGRVHLHRQHHVDRHRHLGRHHGQGHRLDPGAERVDRRRADLHHRQRHPGAQRQVPRRPAHLRPQHAAQGARHHRSRSPTPPTRSAAPRPAGSSTGCEIPSTSTRWTRRPTSSPRCCRRRSSPSCPSPSPTSSRSRCTSAGSR